MSKSSFFTNARKVTLASTIGAVTGAAIAGAVTRSAIMVCPVLGVSLVTIALAHKKMAAADEFLKDSDVEYIIPTRSLVYTACVNAASVAIGGALADKLVGYASNRFSEKPAPVVDATPVV